MADLASVRGTSERLDAALQAIETHGDPILRHRAREAVELLLTLQGTALERIVDLAGDPALGGPALVTRLADDAVIGPLLVIHGIHPHDPATRVARTLDRLRSRIAATGCRASLSSIDGTVARLRVEGFSRLDGESASTLEQWLETRLLEAAPELTAILIDDPGGTLVLEPKLIQITRSTPQR
jgi:hypothetical protein